MEGPHGPIPYPSAQLCYQQPSSQGPSQSAFSDLSTRLHTHIIKPVIPRTLEERDESFTVEGSPLERAKTAITHDAHGALWDDDGEGEEAVSSRLQQHVRQSGHAHTPPNTQESEEDNEYPVDMDLVRLFLFLIACMLSS